MKKEFSTISNESEIKPSTKDQWLKNYHGKELRAFETKIDSNWNELRIQRDKEIEILKKQFKTAKFNVNSKYLAKMNRIQQYSNFQANQFIY